MANKSFSIYSAHDFAVQHGHQMVIEIANTHMACIVRKENKKSILACELFSFNEDEGENLDQLFSKITPQSKILNSDPVPVDIYINNEFCIPVPIFKFNKDISADYLNLVFGVDFASKIQFEHLPVEPGIMNIYRVNQQWLDSLDQRFHKFSIHHTFSNIIRTHVQDTEGLAEELLTVHFYNTFIIVVVMKERALQLIQSFVYETPEDVLYYLLNISGQYELYSDALTIQISGMIDKDYKLYRELITYFKKVTVEYVNGTNLLLNVEDHPLHYFTPYFNLAL